MTVLGLVTLLSTRAHASDVVVGISGTLGQFNYGNQPAALNDGSFSGTVTFASIAASDLPAYAIAADVNFYDSSDDLVFTVDSGIYATLSGNTTGYTTLILSGKADVGGGSTVDVSSLDLAFTAWSYGAATGTVGSYENSNYFSSVEYTYSSSGLTYFNPVESGQASLPEPMSLIQGLIGLSAFGLYRRSTRRR
jgi:hypothetical protein